MDLRPSAHAFVLFALCTVFGCAIAISCRRLTLANVFQVAAWEILAVVLLLGILGSVNVTISWFGLVLWGVLLFFWTRFGLRELKSMRRNSANRS